jgi:hypothetical protein
MNENEDVSMRRAAASGLGGMGEKAASALRKVTRSSDSSLRETAHHAMIRALSLDKKEYYAQVLEDDPFDPNAPGYLGSTKGIYNSGRLDRLTERVKNAIRERLAKKPDAELSWTLATIIQDQLRGTSIHFAAPVDGVSSRTDRENPKESFATLEKVAIAGFRAAEKGSDRWRQFGVGLAKLSLLRGDWRGMNRRLASLGWDPIPSTRRRYLAAPPVEWKEDLAKTWVRADESMRSGNCGVVFRFEKDGKALRGVHVMIKPAPPKQGRSFSTGIAADTLYLAPHPFPRFMGSFGYHAADRDKTRYAVSDSKGIVRLTKLPDAPVKFEVLVPAGNFSEAGSAWELWMKNANGKFQRASMTPIDGAITPRSREAQLKLIAGKTVEYPRLAIRPRFGLNVHDWARADKDSFVLTWNSVSPRPADYALELSLSAPQQHPGWLPSLPVLETREEIVSGTSWPIGKRGVGGLTLEPGNLYVVRVTARDEAGDVMSQSPLTRIWIPWAHRTTAPPSKDRDSGGGLPIYEGIWWRTSANGVKLRPRIKSFLKTKSKAFEHEYVRVGEAWIDWRDGKKADARKKFAALLSELPERNSARATAHSLAESLDSGAACPKRLNFRSFLIPDDQRPRK